MSVREWVEARAVELLASLFAIGLLIGGLAAGIPFLRARIPEVVLYSICCLSAVILHATLDLSVRGARRLVHARTTRTAAEPLLEPVAA